MVLVPFVLGFTVAYLLNPLVDRFTAFGLRRDRVVLILYTVCVGGGVLITLWMLPALFREINATIANTPTYIITINSFIDSLNEPLREFLKPLLGKKAGGYGIPFRAEQMMLGIVDNLPSNLMNVAHIALWLIIVPFVSFFALADGKKWIDALFNFTPSRYVESLLGLLAELNARLGGYVRGVLFESMCVGFLTIIGLHLLDIEGAVLYGVVTGLVNVVPFMAFLIGGSLALLAAIIQGKSALILFGILLLFILVRLIDDFVLIPFVIGNSVRLHPLLMVFAVLVGVETAGFFGLVFAIPLAVVVKVVATLFLKSRRDPVVLQHQSVLS